jgi:dTDP-4-dehydrorhamnose reductase
VYGATKLRGEEGVLSSGADAYVVRTAWVYGLEGKNFVRTILTAAKAGKPLRVVDDQRGAPTWARDIAQASRRLVDAGPPDVYHLTNGGQCTWFEAARAACELAGFDVDIAPVSSAEFAAPAPRPAYSVLANRRWQELGEAPLRPWNAALAEFVPQLLEAGL